MLHLNSAVGLKMLGLYLQKFMENINDIEKHLRHKIGS
jgi:hypothetical protein